MEEPCGRVGVGCFVSPEKAAEVVADKFAANLDKYLSSIPLNRIAEPADVANVVVFLSSAAADYMTGTTLDLTGGMLMR